MRFTRWPSSKLRWAAAALERRGKKENLEEMRSRAKEAINNGFGEELLILGGLWCGVVVVVENGSRG